MDPGMAAVSGCLLYSYNFNVGVGVSHDPTLGDARRAPPKMRIK